MRAEEMGSMALLVGKGQWKWTCPSSHRRWLPAE
jgi:hypothetical protein